MSLPVRETDDFQREAEKLKVEISSRHTDALLGAIEVLITGDILPCLSSSIRMSLLKAAAEGKLTSPANTKKVVDQHCKASHWLPISDSAILQHLALLKQMGLVKEDLHALRPTELTGIFYPAFETFARSLFAFGERKTSLMRCSILSRLAFARRDGIESLTLSKLAKHCGIQESSLFKDLKQLQRAGLVERDNEKAWGTPYAISKKGLDLVQLTFKAVDDYGKVILQIAARTSEPQHIIFPTRTTENVSLIYFSEHRIILELTRPLSATLHWQ